MSEALELQATSTSHARAEDKTYRLTATDSSSYQVHVYFHGINLELVHGASETRTLERQLHDVILESYLTLYGIVLLKTIDKSIRAKAILMIFLR